ncbi:MAG: DNA circularization N-terminal domain-containing protein [Desulfovibrio sp.]|nr:DNA circularization N-terminal domain-containing protein [Desulfovibrio sp.]
MLATSFFASLRQASFRGAAFEVDDADESGGRRLARHEYPLRDLPFAEDLGRKAGEWRIRAFIVQGRTRDYAEARDALRKALTAYGPATLIHPWLGELTVAVERFSLRETTSKGGYCEFDIDFVEAGQRENPAAKTDTVQDVGSAAQKCREALRESFTALYTPLSQELSACLDALNRGAAEVMEYLQLPGELIAPALDFAGGLIGQPSGLFGALSGIFGGLLGSLSAAEALALGFDFGLLAGGSVDEDGYFHYGPASALPARRREVLDRLLAGGGVTMLQPLRRRKLRMETATSYFDSQPTEPLSLSVSRQGLLTATAIPAATALKRHLAQVTVMEDAAGSAGLDFVTADDALAVRKTVLDGLEAVAPVVQDPVFAALSGLRLSVARDLTTRGGELPRVRRAQLPASMPALVAAWRLHGDASRADEIVARNRIRHPGRVPGGTPLEVLGE